MAMDLRSPQANLEPTDMLVKDEAGMGTLGIVLIIILVLILLGVIGFSFNA